MAEVVDCTKTRVQPWTGLRDSPEESADGNYAGVSPHPFQEKVQSMRVADAGASCTKCHHSAAAQPLPLSRFHVDVKFPDDPILVTLTLMTASSFASRKLTQEPISDRDLACVVLTGTRNCTAFLRESSALLIVGCSESTGTRSHDRVLRLRLVSCNPAEGGEARIAVLAQFKEAVVDDGPQRRRIVAHRIRHARTDAEDGAALHPRNERTSAAFVPAGAIRVAYHDGLGVVPRLELEERIAALALVLGLGLTEHQPSDSRNASVGGRRRCVGQVSVPTGRSIAVLGYSPLAALLLN